MRKFPIQLFTLAICVTALVAVPMVTPAGAAANSSKHVKKNRIHANPGIENSRSSHQAPSNQTPPSNNPYEDFDRKASY
jgi:hypothetical protein